MEKLLFLPVYLFFLAVPGFSGDLKTPEWIPPYTVVKSVPDPALSKTESVFVFEFKSYGSPVVAKPVRLSYNGIEKTVATDAKGLARLKLAPGKYKFQFYLDTEHLEIYTDSIKIKPGYRTTMEVRFESSDMPAVAEKPVIYVYPDKTQQVSIQLDVKGVLQFAYPAYNNGWNFIADPDGTIRMNDKTYDYLFWDAQTIIDANNSSLDYGFVLSRDSLVPFFEKQLKMMGLNSRESQDFITYWCPRMMQNEKNYVHFEFNKGCEQFAGMTINPKPDQLFRVFMIWSDAAKADCTNLHPQPIVQLKRSGFTVVEWGGAEMQQLPAAFVAR